MPSTMISDGVLLLYQQRRKSKKVNLLRIKFLKERHYSSTLSSVHLRFPFFSGEGLRVVGGLNMIGRFIMVKFTTLTKKSRSKVSDQ